MYAHFYRNAQRMALQTSLVGVRVGEWAVREGYSVLVATHKWLEDAARAIENTDKGAGETRSDAAPSAVPVERPKQTVAEVADTSGGDAASPAVRVEQSRKPAEPVARKADSDRASPAVPIEESVGEDYLVCLENGRRFKTLTRHLREAHGLTPDAYREKWGLPPDYPMTAPGLAAKRAAASKSAAKAKKPKAASTKRQDKAASTKRRRKAPT